MRTLLALAIDKTAKEEAGQQPASFLPLVLSRRGMAPM